MGKMRHIFLWCAGLFFVMPLFAQEADWLEKAYEKGARIHLNEVTFRIAGLNKATLNVHKIIEVLNERGRDYGTVVLPENSFVQVKKIQAQIYDQSGREIRRLKGQDVRTTQVSPGYELYSDTRYKHFRLTALEYPYTIDMRYEIQYKSLFFWPDWYPQADVPVKKAIYRLVLDFPVEFKWLARGVDVEPEVRKKPRGQEQLWVLENIPPRKEEPFMPPEADVQMAVYFVPGMFGFGGKVYTSQTWEDFGRFYLELSRLCYGLNTQAVNQIEPLLQQANPVNALYGFLQDYTRYVAIEIGIGGWQPTRADEVFRNRYGDCKDLSTLMISMLQHAGQRAYPVLLLTRDKGRIRPELPSSQFNHVIVMVPAEKDTVWLECTADFLPPGDLPPNSEDADGMVVTETGSFLIRTPLSSAQENTWYTRLQAMINSDRSLEIEGNMRFMGNYAYHYRNRFNYEKSSEQRERLHYLIAEFAPHFILRQFRFENLDRQFEKPLMVQFRGKISRYLRGSGKRLFLKPSLIHRIEANRYQQDEKRVFPVYFGPPRTLIDSLAFVLPENYSIEAAPDTLEINNAFLVYRFQHYQKGDTLWVYRYYERRVKEIPVSAYEDWLADMKRIDRQDNSSFILKHRAFRQ